MAATKHDAKVWKKVENKIGLNHKTLDEAVARLSTAAEGLDEAKVIVRTDWYARGIWVTGWQRKSPAELEKERVDKERQTARTKERQAKAKIHRAKQAKFQREEAKKQRTRDAIVEANQIFRQAVSVQQQADAVAKLLRNGGYDIKKK